MQRREVLRITALLTGAAVAAPLAASLLSGCAGEPASDGLGKSPKFLSDTDFQFLTEVIDTVLPAGSSPSASDVGVNYIIDHMLGEVYSNEDQNSWTRRYEALAALLNSSAKPFAELPVEERVRLLVPLDDGRDESDAAKGFRDIKQQTIAYYLTTEKISKEYLNFLPVPGEYQPCIALEEVDGKAWAI